MLKDNISSYSSFNEELFVKLLFRLLLEENVNLVNKKNLVRKLACYYNNDEYRTIFSNMKIKKGVFQDEVIIDESLWHSYNSESINIASCIDCYISKETTLASLSSIDTKIMASMVKQMAKLFKLENNFKYPLCILPCSPNKDYVICSGNNIFNYRWDVITDAFVYRSYKMEEKYLESYHFDSPLRMERELKLKNGTAYTIVLRDGSYAILKGMENNLNKRAEVYTTVTDENMLDTILLLATDDKVMGDEPYVKSLKK